MPKFHRRFDPSLNAQVRRLPQWVHQPLYQASIIGHPMVVLVLLSILTIVAILWNKPHLALSSACIIALVGLNSILKLIVKRARPNTDYAKSMLLETFSFPSGHAAASMLGFGFLAYLAGAMLATPWNIIVVLLLAGFIFTIGLSRVYLGAHHPSDVLGGWLFGGAGLLAIILIAEPLV